MKKEHKEILNLSKIDPLHVAELITGSSYKTDDNTSYLGLAIQMEKSKQLNELLISIGDTTLSNKLNRYLEIVTKFGFQIIYEKPFTCDKRNEKHYILFHHDFSILLNFDTFSWEPDAELNINSGNFYYNWAPHDLNNRLSFTSSGGFFSEKDAPHLTLFERDFSNTYYIPMYPNTPEWESGLQYKEWKRLCDPVNKEQDRLFNEAFSEGKRAIWVGNHDCRQSIITNIKALFENGIFVKEWKQCAFPWLTNYSDHKGKESYPFTSLYEKTKSIISTFPIYVQKAIGSYNK